MSEGALQTNEKDAIHSGSEVPRHDLRRDVQNADARRRLEGHRGDGAFHSYGQTEQWRDGARISRGLPVQLYRLRYDAFRPAGVVVPVWDLTALRRSQGTIAQNDARGATRSWTES